MVQPRPDERLDFDDAETEIQHAQTGYGTAHVGTLREVPQGGQRVEDANYAPEHRPGQHDEEQPDFEEASCVDQLSHVQLSVCTRDSRSTRDLRSAYPRRRPGAR